MSKLIKQYEMETQITEAMADQWGYSRRQALSGRKKRISINGFDVLETKPFPRFAQSFDAQVQNKPKIYGEHKNYMRLTQGLFKEFNYVVSYKNCKAKKEVIEIRNPQPKSQLQIIQEQIKDMNQEIMKSTASKSNNHFNNLDFDTSFKLYNKVNKLFRKFHKASKEKVPSNSLHQTRSNSLSYKVPKNISRNEFKPSKLNYEFIKQRKRMDSLLQPFQKFNEDSFVESKRIQTKISHEKEIMELYKSKVDEMKKSTIKQYKSQRQIALPDYSENQNQNCQTQPNYQLYDMKTVKTNHQLDFQNIARSKQRKEKIFTKILKNKNAKYIRSKGTNCLVKYNENQEAKQLLNGKFKTKQISNEDNQKKQQLQPINTHDYDINVMAGPPKKIPDNRDYQAQFRNEKVQISMRLRKREVSR